MNDLVRYYTARLIVLAVGVALFGIFVDQFAIPKAVAALGQDSWPVTILGNLNSRIAIFLYLTAGEIGVRKYLWKLEKPELDFSGEWTGESNYNTVQIGDVHGHVPFSTQHLVRIEQDCLSLRIAPSSGAGFVHWGSLALDLAEGNTLRYAYWVNYADKSRFPEKAKGYEEMKVTRYDGKRRPNVMTGEFFHCAQGMIPVYSGTVTFSRKT